MPGKGRKRMLDLTREAFSKAAVKLVTGQLKKTAYRSRRFKTVRIRFPLRRKVVWALQLLAGGKRYGTMLYGKRIKKPFDAPALVHLNDLRYLRGGHTLNGHYRDVLCPPPVLPAQPSCLPHHGGRRRSGD